MNGFVKFGQILKKGVFSLVKLLSNKVKWVLKFIQEWNPPTPRVLFSNCIFIMHKLCSKNAVFSFLLSQRLWFCNQLWNITLTTGTACFVFRLKRDRTLGKIDFSLIFCWKQQPKTNFYILQWNRLSRTKHMRVRLYVVGWTRSWVGSVSRLTPFFWNSCQPLRLVGWYYESQLSQ